MESFQYSPVSSRGEKMNNLSSGDGLISRMVKLTPRREKVLLSDLENWFNFSFILVSQLTIAGGVVVAGVLIWVSVSNGNIPSMMHPKQMEFLAIPGFASVVACLSPVIGWISCFKYQEEKNRKSRIVLASALGYVMIILMLTGTNLCYQLQTFLLEKKINLHNKHVIHSRNSSASWHLDFENQLLLLLGNSFLGSNEREDWNTLQTSMSCCGVHSFRDWLDAGEKIPIPNSCCINKNEALNLSRNYPKSEDLFCCSMQVLNCVNEQCGISAPFLLSNKSATCQQYAVTPVGCLEKIELVLLNQALLFRTTFFFCIAFYVIAEIIMGIFLFIFFGHDEG